MTNRGEYELSFRIWHPIMTPEEISAGIGSKPDIFWCAGQPRRTPKGTELPGVYEETYWVADLGVRSAFEILVSALADTVADLEKNSAFLKKITDTGGIAELFVIWYGSGAFTLPAGVLQRLSALSLNLSMDICIGLVEPREHEGISS
jgi:hypothetical protein